MTRLILLGLGTLAFGFALSSVAGGIARGGPESGDVGRKVVHVGIFTGAVPAHLLGGFWGIVTYGTVVALLVLASWRLGPGSSLFDALARSPDLDLTEEPSGPRQQKRSGTILAPLISTAMGGLLSTVLMGNLAVVGYLACGWGDAAGEAVGKRWGKRTYAVPFSSEGGGIRSLEGSAGVFFTGSVGAGVALLLLGFQLPSALGTGLACGLVAAISEGLSSSGTDNFWVQLLPTLTAWWMLG